MTDEVFYKKRSEMKEEWKQLRYNGELQNYEISNTGKIRKFDTKMELKLIKVPGMKNTYEFVNIVFNDKSMRRIGIHRLMAIAFIPIPNKYLKKGYTISDLVVDHIDDAKYHNIIENLQWLTQSENIRKSPTVGTRDMCLSDKVVHKICKDLCKGLTIYELSLKYNVSELIVHDIRYKLRYKNISNQYKFPLKQLSEEDAIKICEALQKGYTIRSIVEEYGYTPATVTDISARNTWTQVSKNYTFPNARLTDDEVRSICTDIMKGLKKKVILKKYDIDKHTYERIKYRRTYTDITKDYDMSQCKFKVHDDIVRKICEDIVSKKYKVTEMAERHKVSTSFVKNLINKKVRSDITKDYTY